MKINAFSLNHCVFGMTQTLQNKLIKIGGENVNNLMFLICFFLYLPCAFRFLVLDVAQKSMMMATVFGGSLCLCIFATCVMHFA